MPDMRARIASVISAAALVIATVAIASAGPATDQLHDRIDRVLKIVSDPVLKKDFKTAQRRSLLREIANEIFDFTEISQRSLGRHWQARTAAEREEFVSLFADLLERTYVSKIESYAGERIVYAGESVDGDQATVRTKLVTKQDIEIPVDYRMHQRDNRWRAFDVSIEGVSLVGTYRAQFNAIIARSSYRELVSRLRVKQDEAARLQAP
jgi:phospholipid transport system substrate-binding protein